MLTDLSIQSLRDRMLLLRSLPAFGPLEDDTLSLVAEYMHLRRFAAGDVLMRFGEPIHRVYIVLEGSVRWRRKLQPSASVASEQEVVGWLSVMARDPDGLEAVVQDDALVIELPSEMLEHALEEDFAIVRNMLRMGAESLLSLRGELPARPDRAPVALLGLLRERRRTLVERLIDMRNVPLFKRGNVEALIALARNTQELEVEPGHVFWQAGDAARFWVVIDYGRVHCENRQGQGMDVGANFVLGIMDAMAQRPHGYAAVAETKVVGNRIELEAFLAVLETHFELARDFLSFIALAVLEQG
jgi:CRP-like cAMP-binding protein